MLALLGSAHKRAKNKARADRQFDRMYGGQSDFAQNGASAAAAPRAAVYSGHMGLRQRRASKIHQTSGTPTTKNPSKIAKQANAASKSHSFSKFHKHLANAAATLVCLGLVALFLYEPASQYYCQMRELARLNAEYAAVEAHNSTLQTSVDTLQSDTGIEDSATSQFGMVKEGEQAVVVTGITQTTEENTFTSNVVPGSVAAPDTWYSSLLDTVFGYSK